MYMYVYVYKGITKTMAWTQSNQCAMPKDQQIWHLDTGFANVQGECPPVKGANQCAPMQHFFHGSLPTQI